MKNRLAELRNKKGLTLKELGQKINMRDNTISQYETGKRKPSEKALTKISDLFRVPASYLQGNGWSQDDVIWLLVYVYVNQDSDNFELPSGVFSEYGHIYKYGEGKEAFQDFYNEDIPGFAKSATDFLMTHKRDKVEHDFINDYYDGEESLIDSNELDEYVKDELSDLVNKYLSAEELNTVREDALDELDNKFINLPKILEELISKKLLESLSKLAIRCKIDLENEDAVISVDDIKSYINKDFFKDFKKEALNKIKSLNDYVFLSNIGENFSNTGIIPEYEISRKISDDLESKCFQDRQDYFKEAPYKASEESVNALSLSKSDKSSLLDVIDYLLNENEELKDRLDKLNERLNEAINSKDFNEVSNDDYRGYR